MLLVASDTGARLQHFSPLRALLFPRSLRPLRLDPGVELLQGAWGACHRSAQARGLAEHRAAHRRARRLGTVAHRLPAMTLGLPALVALLGLPVLLGAAVLGRLGISLCGAGAFALPLAILVGHLVLGVGLARTIHEASAATSPLPASAGIRDVSLEAS